MDSIGAFARHTRVVMLAGTVALCAACAKRDATSPMLDVSVSVSAGGQSAISVHQTLQLTPTVRDSNGVTLTGQTVTWSSSDTMIASVSQSGVATGRSPGLVTVTATSDGGQGTIPLTVVPAVASVSVSLAQPGTLAAGGSTVLYAGVSDSSGNGISGLPVVWSSSDSVSATITSDNTSLGTISSLGAPGAVTISATVAGVTGSTTVTIVPLSAVASIIVKPATITFVASDSGFGAATQMSVAAADASGNTVLGPPTTWTISNAAAATVSSTGSVTPNTAVVTGSAQTATVRATVGVAQDTALVLVCPEVHSIAVSKSAVSLQVGQTDTVAVTELDARGNVDLAPLTAETVNPNGKVVSIHIAQHFALIITGLAAGTSTLDFFDPVSGVKSQNVAITVSP